MHVHRNGDVFILMKFSSLTVPEVVKMTIPNAASDESSIPYPQRRFS